MHIKYFNYILESRKETVSLLVTSERTAHLREEEENAGLNNAINVFRVDNLLHANFFYVFFFEFL